jgi:hypothetical protein
MTDSTVPAWEVTQQTEATDIGPTGAYVSGVRVTFRTASGAVGSVFVPHTDYTVERVRAAIAARAGVIEGVAGLQG